MISAERKANNNRAAEKIVMAIKTERTESILRSARDLIANPSTWTKGSSARDGAARGVCFDDASAVCWCSWGAIEKVCKQEGYLHAESTAAEDILYKAIKESHGETFEWIGPYNDGVTHTDVLRVFDRAIELAAT